MQYETVTKSLQEIDTELNARAKDGWKPILMATTSTSPYIQTPTSITVILQKES